MKIKKHSIKIKNQSVKEIESNKTYNEWAFLKDDERNSQKKINEPVQANPENIPESSGYYYQTDASKETSEKVHKLMEWAPHFLTEKQWRVFDSIAVQMNSVKETAFILGLTRSTINKHFKAAQKRLQRLYETI